MALRRIPVKKTQADAIARAVEKERARLTGLHATQSISSSERIRSLEAALKGSAEALENVTKAKAQVEGALREANARAQRLQGFADAVELPLGEESDLGAVEDPPAYLVERVRAAQALGAVAVLRIESVGPYIDNEQLVARRERLRLVARPALLNTHRSRR